MFNKSPLNGLNKNEVMRESNNKYVSTYNKMFDE